MAAVFSLSGCVDYKNLKITSFKIDNITPEGLRSVSGTASVGVDNPSAGFSIYNVAGTVKRGGKDFGTFTAEPVKVEPKSSMVYNVSGTMSLASQVSILEVLSTVTSLKVDDFTVDVSCTVKPRGGAAKKIELRGIPARKVLNKLQQK